MSNPSCQAIRMKIKKSFRFQFPGFNFIHGAGRQTIRLFGFARLVKNANGCHELIGGTPADHAAARQWCSLFAHEVVFTVVPEVHPTRKFTVFAA